MAWTKRELIADAFGAFGLANYVFDLTPEQMQDALRRLDSMMGQWETQGVYLGYVLPATPGASDLDDDSGIPVQANEAVSLNLARRLAPTIGKALSAETILQAGAAYRALLGKRGVQRMPEMQMPANMPSGAGNKGWRDRDPFLVPPSDEVPPESPLTFD